MKQNSVKFSNSRPHPNPEFQNFNPDIKSRNSKFLSRIPIPNPEIQIPKSGLPFQIPEPNPDFRDRDLIGIIGI